jgi:hypothetical protein
MHPLIMQTGVIQVCERTVTSAVGATSYTPLLEAKSSSIFLWQIRQKKSYPKQFEGHTFWQRKWVIKKIIVPPHRVRGQHRRYNSYLAARE